jgi:hypothetical protein
MGEFKPIHMAVIQHSRRLEPQLLNAVIIFTTIHAQDFRDEVGDRAVGRHTIPTEMPEIGRVSILIGVIGWSIIIGAFFSSSTLASSLLITMGTWIGSRFYLLRDIENDRKSYTAYNVGIASSLVVSSYDLTLNAT